MRTTITLDDNLLAKLKKRASEADTSVSRLIEQAVQLLMHAPGRAKRQERFKLVTFGAGGHFSKRDIDKTSALLEPDDRERFARRSPSIPRPCGPRNRSLKPFRTTARRDGS